MASATKTPPRFESGVGEPIDMTPHNYPMKLLRRRDVCNKLGITDRQLEKLVASGLVKPIVKRGCRAWYRAKDLEAL